MIDWEQFFSALMEIQEFTQFPSQRYLDALYNALLPYFKEDKVQQFGPYIKVILKNARDRLDDTWNAAILCLIELALDVKCMEDVISRNDETIAQLKQQSEQEEQRQRAIRGVQEAASQIQAKFAEDVYQNQRKQKVMLRRYEVDDACATLREAFSGFKDKCERVRDELGPLLDAFARDGHGAF